jgi:hypothetical protein
MGRRRPAQAGRRGAPREQRGALPRHRPAGVPDPVRYRAPCSRSLARAVRPERAIGVVYKPETERHSHYFQARLADQFDALIHIDVTTAVEPLERTPRWEAGEVPETYPFAV